MSRYLLILEKIFDAGTGEEKSDNNSIQTDGRSAAAADAGRYLRHEVALLYVISTGYSV